MKTSSYLYETIRDNSSDSLKRIDWKSGMVMSLLVNQTEKKSFKKI
jgi:hypothetical protein